MKAPLYSFRRDAIFMNSNDSILWPLTAFVTIALIITSPLSLPMVIALINRFWL